MSSIRKWISAIYWADVGQKRLKYLDMLQAVIRRMAGNQFTCRKWSVGLGAAIIGLASAKEGDLRAALVAILPAACFWIQDAYYLALEQKFRALFNAARVIQDDAPDFSFEVEVKFGDSWSAFRRPAVWLVHAPVLLMALLVGGWGWLSWAKSFYR
jgi:hypothetical protein